MSLEAQLTRIADALEAMLQRPPEAPAAAEKPKKAPAKKKPASSGPDKDDVRAALKDLQKAKGPQAARDLLAENGAKTLTDLDSDAYSAVIESAKERSSE